MHKILFIGEERILIKIVDFHQLTNSLNLRFLCNLMSECLKRRSDDSIIYLFRELHFGTLVLFFMIIKVNSLSNILKPIKLKNAVIN